MDKVYCKNCVYVNYEGSLCKAPIDNWLAPNAKRNHLCSRKNEKNDCKDFKEKEKSGK